MKKVFLSALMAIVFVSCAAKERVVLDVPANTPQELQTYAMSVLESEMTNEEKSEWFYHIGAKALSISNEMSENLDLDNVDIEAYRAITNVLLYAGGYTNDKIQAKELKEKHKQMDAVLKLSTFGFSM